MNKSRGFTLLEILLVVGIIAILAGIVIVALNPTKQFAAVRNTQRKANLSELNKALYQYYIDNSRYPTSVTTTLTEICDTEATSTGHSLNCTNKIDLSYLVPTYLVAIPTDPQASGTSTGYLVAKNTANKVYLKADNAELSQTTTIGDTSGVLPDHLVSYWSFDGDMLDHQGTNNGSCTTCPTLTTGVSGLANTAYSFDGVDDYISATVATNPGSNYAVSWWMNASSFVGERHPLGLFQNSNQLYQATGSGLLKWFIADIVSSSDSDVIGQWSNYVIVSNSVGRVIYKNGVSSAVGASYLISNMNIQIGSGLSGSWKFNGLIDNVRVYNKSLSADEVLNIYNTEKP